MNNAGSHHNDNAPYGVPPPTPQQPKPAWWKRAWLLALAAWIIGLLIGLAAATVLNDVTASPEFKAVVDERDASRSALAEAETALSGLEDELTRTQSELEETIGELPAREAAVTEAEAAVAEREATVAASEKEVAKREKAVEQVEKTIAENTISGSGIYEVGVDMKAGKYKSAGATDCYYAVNADANGNDIVSNNITNGPTVVTVKKGQFFETNRCADWVLQR